MRVLSKSKLMSFRQCPKRLWLEIHSPDLNEVSAASQSAFDMGNQVGDMARRLYDPRNKGVAFEIKNGGLANVIAQTAELLESNRPIFEAGFSANGARSFADVMLPVRRKGKKAWRMIEVKAASSVKDHYRDDVAIQSYVARSSGLALASVSLAHIDNTFVYSGDGNYEGLFTEHDMTEEASSRDVEVEAWIAGAHKTVRKRVEPTISTGRHCKDPNPCGFLDYCSSQEARVEYPVEWLPRIQTKALKDFLADGVDDLREIPDNLLNKQQLRVKTHSISKKTYFDAEGAAADLAPHKLPAYFLDFETIQMAVPIWKKRRPFSQIPFQFSLHRMGRNRKLKHDEFLDLTGKDPANAFAVAMLAACGERGPIFVYHEGFEKARIKELANFLPRYKTQLLALNERIVDLLTVARARYYHPSQEGSWSIKKVLPAIAPDLSYQDLIEVQDGGAAMRAYQEATSPETSAERKSFIQQALLKYCELDTYAMVRLWKFFSGRQHSGM